jgi:hypothetical protein
MVKGENMKNTLNKLSVLVIILSLLLLTPLSYGVLTQKNEYSDRFVYRTWNGCAYKIPVDLTTCTMPDQSTAIKDTCKNLFEQDDEMQQLCDKIYKFSEKNNFINNMTFCLINSSGDGVHLKLEVSDYVFNLLLDWFINKLTAWGFTNFMNTLNEFLDIFDFENNTIGLILLSRFNQDGQTTLEPQMTAEDNVYINGSHSLLTLGFFGYISYNSLFKRGYSTFYGVGILTLYR